MKKLFIVLSLFMLASVQAQETATISGFIREDATGEPVAYANVFLAETALGAASNVDGYFVITNIPAGNYDLRASMMGFGQYRAAISLTFGQTVRLNIRLKEVSILTDEVTVTAERQKFERTIESSNISLDIREINAAPAFIEADVFRTLQMLPGVQTSSDFSSALYVRGSTPDQNMIMLDGISVYNPYHLGGIFSTFNTDAIKEADFHAGGFPARYGGRMGAILNIINREGNTERITGSGNVSLISTKGLLEGPIPQWNIFKGSWMISGRRTYFDKIIDLLHIPIGSSGDNNGDTGEQIYLSFPYHFYDYQIKTNLDIGFDHRLTYTRFYGDDILDFEGSDTETYDNGEGSTETETTFGLHWPWGNHTNGLTWRWIVSPTIVAKTFLSNSRYRFDFDFSVEEISDYSTIDSTEHYEISYGLGLYDIIKDNTIETEVIWKLDEQHSISGGFQVKEVNFDLGMGFNIATLDTTLNLQPLELSNKTRESSVFLQDKWDISPLLKLQGGLRVTDYSLHDSLYIEPRLGLKYIVSHNISLKFNWGRYHQFLTTANSPDETLRLVDLWMGIPEEYPASVSEHSIAGIEYLSPKDILFRVEAYYKGFDNMLTLKQGELFSENEGELEVTPFNEFWKTDAYAYGLELLIKKSTGKLKGWIGYTFARTFYKTPQAGWYAPNFDRTHTLNIVGNYNFTNRAQISASLSNSSGNPYTPIIGRIYDWEQYLSIGSFWNEKGSYLVGDKNSSRYSSYFRIDLGFTSKTKELFGLKYSKYYQLINISNHTNIMTYTYRTIIDRSNGNKLGVQRRPVPMFPLIFTFGVKFEF
ncbi:TonB-dependent receptor [bacterium]|nr:TonB-dependent receptor [bacterium]